MSETADNNGHSQDNQEDHGHDITPVGGLYEDWFLDYASYVILERAVPAMEDGLKPVQRRILHAMKEIDDGRYNKVANIIGQTMQYHPHGDAAIGDAMVQLGQKGLLLDTQGNWGDVRTGDSAAAPRYIEARLSAFALEVAFNEKITEWQISYDGRKKEPVHLPMKFPLVLAQGVEGIAVGLSTKIMPHNFCELIEASIDHLKGKKVDIYPDFPTGGLADFSQYNEGTKGGRIRVRAKIEQVDKKTLAIRDIPYTTTTHSLIDSIIKANDNGKIKIKKVVDNTAEVVEILVYLAPGMSPDMTIDALYAFTDCEVSVSPNACVIIDDKPHFLSVNEILRQSTNNTVELLRKELEIKRDDLKEKLLFSSLEKIFIENRIYRDIEECETWEAVLETIDQGLEPFKPQFYREITQDDIIRLTEIRIKRISKYDTFKADEQIRKLENELEETEYNLAHLTDYAIRYFQHLLDKYGADFPRKTLIQKFDTIEANVVAATNQKLYVNRKEGFVGFGLKKDEYVCDCSDLDDIIAFRRDGTFIVSRVDEKVYMGKDIVEVRVFKKNDERMVYNMIYKDGKSGYAYGKRFQILSVTRDREYDLTKGNKGSRALYLTSNPNGEAEVVTVYLTPGSKARKKVFDFDFAQLDIKGRGSQGNIVTKYPVKKIQLKQEGVTTLGGLDVWFDDTTGRLNSDGRGKYLGNFEGEDKVLVIYKNGTCELTGFEFTNRYEAGKILEVSKLGNQMVVVAVYYDGNNQKYYVKRFRPSELSAGKKYTFITDHKQSSLVYASTKPVELQVTYGKRKGQKTQGTLNPETFIDVKGWKAQGNKLADQRIHAIEEVEKQAAEEESGEKLPEGNQEKAAVGSEASSEQQENKDRAEDDGSGAEEDAYEVGSTISFDVKEQEENEENKDKNNGKGEDEEQLGLF